MSDNEQETERLQKSINAKLGGKTPPPEPKGKDMLSGQWRGAILGFIVGVIVGIAVMAVFNKIETPVTGTQSTPTPAIK